MSELPTNLAGFQIKPDLDNILHAAPVKELIQKVRKTNKLRTSFFESFESFRSSPELSSTKPTAPTKSSLGSNQLPMRSTKVSPVQLATSMSCRS
jgi:hypothetical protein